MVVTPGKVVFEERAHRAHPVRAADIHGRVARCRPARPWISRYHIMDLARGCSLSSGHSARARGLRRRPGTELRARPRLRLLIYSSVVTALTSV
jgi:hypothetical protein